MLASRPVSRKEKRHPPADDQHTLLETCVVRHSEIDAARASHPKPPPPSEEARRAVRCSEAEDPHLRRQHQREERQSLRTARGEAALTLQESDGPPPVLGVDQQRRRRALRDYARALSV